MNPTTNTVTYTPNPDAIAGSDSFTFTVNDGTVDSQPATVSITLEVTPNQPPTAQPVSDTLVQGQSKDIVLKGSDPDTDDKLVFFIVNGPQNGQLGEINQETGVVSYTPNEGYTGEDTFTYIVNDLTVDSNETTVTVNVQAPPNKPPTAQAGSTSVVQGTPKDIKLNATDPDTDDKLVFSLVNGPQNGQLGEINQETGVVSYTPNEGYTGEDTFTYKVNDGTVDSEPIQVTITVQAPPNKPPTAQAGSTTIVQGTPKDIKLNATDPDTDDKLVFSLVNGPQNGQLGEINQETGMLVSYTPNEGYTGEDTFTYKVNDGTVDSEPIQVTITVQAPPNKPPTAQAGSTSVVQGTPKDIKLNATDPDTDDKLVFSLVNGPQNGQLGEINQETGVVSYTPNEGYTGEDTFTYKVNDGTVDSEPIQVTITVQAPPNKPPTAQAGSTSVVQGTPKDIKLNATDPDTDDKLVFSLVNGPQNGQLGEINQETGVVSYTPNEGYTGEDTFTYKVNDGTVDSEPIQVTITVQAPPNKPPTAQAGSTSVVQGTPKDIKLNATDPDTDDKLVFSLVNGPQNGQLGEINQETGVVSYTPNEGYTGEDTFTYKVNDGTVDSEPIQVTITVQAPPNKPPTAQAGSTSVVQGTPKDIKLNATDPDTDDKLVFSIVKQPTKGKLGEINAERNTVTYTPNPNVTSGTDIFSFKVNDDTVDSAEAIVTVNVQDLVKPQILVEKQEIKDNDKDGIAYEIDDEPNKKSTKFRDINGTTFGEVLNYGDQTINIFKADIGKKIIVISVSSKGDEPALISSCNEKENFVESGDRLELRCKVSTN